MSSMPTPTPSLDTTLRFATEHAGYLPQFDPVFRRPITDGWNALPMGNGDLTAVVWQPGHLTWMLNTGNIDPAISQLARIAIETPTPLAERLGRLESRLSLVDATVTMQYDGGVLPPDAAGIWPHRATGANIQGDRVVRSRHARFPEPGEVDQGSVQVVTWIPADRNVLLIDYRAVAPLAQPTAIVLERWRQEEWGDVLQVAEVEEALTLTYATNNGVSYSVALVAEGWEGASSICESSTRLVLNLPVATEASGRLAIAVVTSHETADPLMTAVALARETLRDTTVRQAHQAFWQTFWDASFVDAGHPYLNALYHMALYELGITSRGCLPVKFNGALNLWHEQARNWGASFWCHNESSVFLPVYAANHIDLAEAFHQWIVEMLPRAREAAQAYYGIAGAFYHEVMTPDYQVREEDGPAHWEIGRILASGVRYALLLWNRYQYTLDEAFLRDRAFPVLRACAEFYQAFATRGDDGEYHLGPALSWEMRPVGTDTHADCAAWRAVFAAAISAAEILNVDANDIAGWHERLSHAPAYPTDGTVFSIVVNQDGQPEPANHWQWQMPQLSSVFPYSVIGVNAPAETRRLAEQTFTRYRYTADAGHEYLPVIAARLGNAEWWRGAMYAFIQFFQAYDQGLFQYFNIHGNRNKDRYDLTSLIPYLEGTGILMTATNEMLLQSHDGVIRVFPAMPDFWHGRFLLRAVGSFLVASEHRGAEEIPYIAVQPVGGAPRQCRVAIPWHGGTELYRNGQACPLVTREGCAEFLAEPEMIYVLLPTGRTLEDISFVAPMRPEPYAPCRLGQVNYGQPDGAFCHALDFPLW